MRYFGLGSTPGYFCTAGKCRGGSPAMVTLFRQLQSEINRVRKVYGLTADLAVDGVIGPATAARLIRLARTISSRVSNVDPTIDTYAIETADLPGPEQVAADATALVQALRRDGYAAGAVPPDVQVGALVEPYLDQVNAGGVTRFPPGNIVMPVGPTATQPPVVPGAHATPPIRMPSGKAAAIGLGVVAALSAGVYAFTRLRRRETA